MIKLYKRSLMHLSTPGTLTYSEMVTLIARSINTVNSRPLGVRHHSQTEGEYCVITPNTLLMGTRNCSSPAHQLDFTSDLQRLQVRVKMLEESFRNWWRQWYTTAWESNIIRPKWRDTERNLRPNDVVLVKYENPINDVWQLGRVTEVHPDDHGLVREVTVATKKGNKKKDSSPEYSPRPLLYRRLAVQRLAVILPAEEQGDLPPADDLHVCDEELRVPLVPQHTGAAKSGHLPPGVPLSPRSQAHGPTAAPQQGVSDLLLSDNVNVLIDLENPAVVSNVCSTSTFSRHASDFICWQCETRRQLF